MQLETIRQQLQQQQARAQTHVDVRGVEKRQVQLDREASSYGEELSRKQRELDCLKLKCAGLEQLRDVKKAAWERCRMSLNEDPAARTKFVESETSRVEALKQKLIAAQSDVVRASDTLARCEERLDQIADLVSETRGELSSIGAATVDATALAQDTQAELESELSLLNGMKSAYEAESKTESERLASAEAVSSAMELQTRAVQAATKRLKEFSVTHAVSNDILTTLASKFGDKFKDVAVLDVESVRVSCERAVVAATSEVEEARAKVKAVQALVRERRRTGGDVEVNVALERSALEVKRSKLAALNSKSAAVLRGVELLEHGILGLAEVISNRHERIYTKLRAMVSAYFAELVPGKQVDLVLVGDALENGLQLVLQSSGESSASISSLSGGERALLALSLLFASGLLKKSPIYLLDEVDAALDEANIHLIASVVHNIFADSQTLCVSHHADFHSKKFNNIRVSIKDGFTIIG
jgi:chromosome segregation protein